MTTPTPPTDAEIAAAVALLREDRLLQGQQAAAARLEAMEQRLRRMPVAEMTAEEKAAEYDRMMAAGGGPSPAPGPGLPPWPGPGGPQPDPQPDPTPAPGVPPAPQPKTPPPAPSGDPSGDPPARSKYGSRWLGDYD